MASRRHVVIGLAAAGSLGPSAVHAATSKPKVAAVPGACDCHVHVLDPERFPYSPNRRYTPGTASVAQLLAMHEALGVQRVIVVQNSVYGPNHDCLLDALEQLGSQRARGIMTIGPTTTDAEIATLDRAGVRGARLNLEVGRDRDPSKAEEALLAVASRIPPTWNIDINAALPVLVAIRDRLTSSGRPIVLDHFGHAEAKPGVGQPGFAELIAMLGSGCIFVKLSGLYQISESPDYSDITPIAKALIAAAPAQIVWGSDWPHTGGANRPQDQKFDVVEPFRKDDDGQNFDLFCGWVPDSQTMKLILTETPARIYGL